MVAKKAQSSGTRDAKLESRDMDNRDAHAHAHARTRTNRTRTKQSLRRLRHDPIEAAAQSSDRESARRPPATATQASPRPRPVAIVIPIRTGRSGLGGAGGALWTVNCELGTGRGKDVQARDQEKEQ